MKHVLKFPFKDITNSEVTSVSFKNEGRVKVGDIMKVAADMERDKAPAQAENAYLVARMCGLDIKEVEAMDVEDFNVVVRMLLAGKPQAS